MPSSDGKRRPRRPICGRTGPTASRSPARSPASAPSRRSGRARSSADRRCASASPSETEVSPAQYSPVNSTSSAPFSRAPRLCFTSAMKIAWISRWSAFSARDVVGVFREERIEHRLVLARGIEPALDADLLDQLLKSERAADHADRAQDRRRIAEDLIARAGDHVAAGGRDILDEHQHRQLLFRGELPDAQDRSGATAPASRRAN